MSEIEDGTLEQGDGCDDPFVIEAEAMTTPKRTLEEIAEELAGPHDYVEGDEWYSCGMATAKRRSNASR